MDLGAMRVVDGESTYLCQDGLCARTVTAKQSARANNMVDWTRIQPLTIESSLVLEAVGKQLTVSW